MEGDCALSLLRELYKEMNLAGFTSIASGYNVDGWSWLLDKHKFAIRVLPDALEKCQLCFVHLNRVPSPKLQHLFREILECCRNWE